MKRIGLIFVVVTAIMFLVYLLAGARGFRCPGRKNRSQIIPPSGGRDFTLKDLAGHDESLGQFRANRSREFLSTWCGPS